MYLTKAQFKCQTFDVTNLKAIWVDRNDVSSMVDSDIELNLLYSIHFYNLQWPKMFTCENNLQ